MLIKKNKQTQKTKTNKTKQTLHSDSAHLHYPVGVFLKSYQEFGCDITMSPFTSTPVLQDFATASVVVSLTLVGLTAVEVHLPSEKV